jgi:hypothetical protein
MGKLGAKLAHRNDGSNNLWIFPHHFNKPFVFFWFDSFDM